MTQRPTTQHASTQHASTHAKTDRVLGTLHPMVTAGRCASRTPTTPVSTISGRP